MTALVVLMATLDLLAAGVLAGVGYLIWNARHAAERAENREQLGVLLEEDLRRIAHEFAHGDGVEGMERVGGP